MSKRKVAVCESEISYVVIETKDEKDCTYVEFVPTIWIKTKAQLAARASAKCFSLGDYLAKAKINI